jgi:hypothetical protein
MILTRDNIIEQNWVNLTIYNNRIDQILTEIPRTPGIYAISTNTPIEILEQCNTRNDPNHYNLGERIQQSRMLDESQKITQKNSNNYIIYNGHQANLRQRASEHFKGSRGTGCLALFEFEILLNYSWTFSYLELISIDNYIDNKLIRTYLEQAHRSRIGWPILCKQ